MNKTSVSLQIIPLGKNQKFSIKIIDAAIAFIKKSGVSYEVGPMETTMEGDLDILIEIVKNIQHLSVKIGAKTIFSNVKIIHSKKGVMSIEKKVKKHRQK